MRVLILTTLCGVAISASYYVIRPLDSGAGYESVPAPLLPVHLLSLLNVVPRLFVARIVWEALRLPGWLGEVMGALYWPALGAFVGTRRRWARWAVGVLVVNVGLLALFFYALSRMRFTF
jgi:hypothetical protein